MITIIFFTVLIPFVLSETGLPKFDPPTESVILQEGYLAKIDCAAEGELPLKYTWYNQSDEEITSDASNAVFSHRTENGCSLIFDVVNASHSGFYSCNAENRHGSSTKMYDIAVKTPLGNITKNETSTIDKVNILRVTEDSVEFAVETSGKPDSFYARYQEKLEKSETVKQFYKGEKVVVRNLTPGGLYTFQFQIESPNAIKLQSKMYNVTLLPRIPDVIFRSLKDGLLEIEWFRSIDDIRREAIDLYEISYNRVQQYRGNNWKHDDCEVHIRISRRCFGSSYTIAGLSSSSYYEIRLRAHTAAGYGKEYVNKIYAI
ncbi:uncharacterized protein NPIL_174521 [Nephila pilipes]|uniref:Ig-like domain-containing protein n=1 Tax=Nephila pilipes TaxID=299642 RepID=A0A8X6NFL9_NEPPI|nr:uncharacterized protein NPIL_174521 [Nephila pilipes]